MKTSSSPFKGPEMAERASDTLHGGDEHLTPLCILRWQGRPRVRGLRMRMNLVSRNLDPCVCLDTGVLVSKGLAVPFILHLGVIKGLKIEEVFFI